MLKLTTREYLSISWVFPDSFWIEPTQGSEFKEIGNSISVPVVGLDDKMFKMIIYY